MFVSEKDRHKTVIEVIQWKIKIKRKKYEIKKFKMKKLIFNKFFDKKKNENKNEI